MSETLSRFEGALVGLAVGDALGMPAEGMFRDDISRMFAGGIGFLPDPRRGLAPGQWTDDTKMMLCHLESILETGAPDGADVARRFLDWLRSGDLRGIGRTTAQALERLARGADWRDSGVGGRWAAGNGAAMRIAPVGLFFAFREGDIYDTVRDLSAITHDNEEAVAGAYVVAELVRRGGSGASAERFDEFLDGAIERVGGTLTAANLRKARGFAADGTAPREALPALGVGGYVVESVAAAVYACLALGADFDSMMRALLLAGGDTDTNAAMAGAIFGAWRGLQAVPETLRETVEDGARIRESAERLWRIAGGEK